METIQQLTTLNKIPFTKSKQAAYAAAFVDHLLSEGSQDPLKTYIEAKALIEVLIKIEANLKDAAISQAAKFKGQKTVQGVKVEVRQGTPKYIYEHDRVWLELKNQITDLTDKLKERELFLKTMPNETVDGSTGEILQPAILEGYTKESIVITFDK